MILVKRIVATTAYIYMWKKNSQKWVSKNSFKKEQYIFTQNIFFIGPSPV